MIDWILDRLGILVIIFVVSLIGVIIWSSQIDKTQKEKACAKMWTLAHTSTDSINVVSKCEYPKEQEVIPIFIPYPTH